jgi:hypothetical protein
MAIFAVLLPIPQPALAQAITSAFPNDHLRINDTQWLISATGTTIEVSSKLGIYDAKEPERPVVGNAIVLAVSSYFGRAPATIWEWIKTKLEASSGG